MDQGTARASGPTPRPRRRVYLVDRRFQLKHVARLAGAGLAVSAVSALGVWLAHRQSMDLAVADPALRAILEADDRWLLLALGGIAVATSVALGLLGLVLTHHVAGPVFVMSHYLSSLAQGRYPRMRPLRRGDALRDFFELFQRAVTVLRERESRHAALVEEAIRRMRNVLDRAPDLEPAVQAMEGLLREERAATADDAGRAG